MYHEPYEADSILLRIKDVMVTKVITINLDQSVKHAANIMCRLGIGCLIVTDAERIIGIVTERDLLQRVIVVSADPEKTLIKHIMSEPVVTADPEMMMEEAVRLMVQFKIKKLPVVEHEGDKEKLVGLVTLTDIASLYPAIIQTLKKIFEKRGEIPPKNLQKVMNYYVV